MAPPAQRIIIKRITKKASGHAHGSSAWKIAYADFVTAMMAFFLMLWLLGMAGQETLEGLAHYFSDSRFNVTPPSGVLGPDDGTRGEPQVVRGSPVDPAELRWSEVAATTPDRQVSGMPGSTRADIDTIGQATSEQGRTDQGRAEHGNATLGTQAEETARFDSARAAILDAVSGSQDLARLSESLMIDQTPEGLRIQLLDRDKLAMFPVGSDRMYPHTKDLLRVVLDAVRGLPNALSIRGHTDSLPYMQNAGYDNWKLSADRAQATRLALASLGLEPGRMAEVVGKADAEHLMADPLDPRNRRISIVLLRATRPMPGGDAVPGPTLDLAPPLPSLE